MKKFVAIYLGSAEGLAQWKAIDDQKRKEQEKAGMEGWMKWTKENEASIVDLGSPLGKTKRIDPNGISDAKNEITAYTIVQAESHRSCRLNSLHIIRISMIFPGQSVEVMAVIADTHNVDICTSRDYLRFCDQTLDPALCCALPHDEYRPGLTFGSSPGAGGGITSSSCPACGFGAWVWMSSSPIGGGAITSLSSA